MDHEDLLTDLQVLAVLLGLLAHLGLRAYLDLLGQKAKMVLQGLQVLTASLAPKGLLDFLGHLVNQLSLFRRCRVYQDPVEIQASRALQASQDPSAQEMDPLDLPAPSGLPALSGLTALSGLSALVASMDLQDLSELPDWMATVQQDPLEVLDLLDQVLTPSDLSDLQGLSGLSALLEKGLSGTQVLEGILAQPVLLEILVRPGPLGLQVPMGTV